MFPIRCKCGRWTQAGLTCVACSRDQFVFSADSDEETTDETEGDEEVEEEEDEGVEEMEGDEEEE